MDIVSKLVSVYKIWQGFLPHFPKNLRYSLGHKIDSLLVEILEYIFIAKYLNPKEKLPYLKKASLKLDLLKFFLMVSWEIKCLDNERYILISEKIDEIGKMLGGWIGKILKLLKETPA